MPKLSKNNWKLPVHLLKLSRFFKGGLKKPPFLGDYVMKKMFVLLVILSSSIAFAAETVKYSKGFSVKFLHCLPAEQEVTFMTEAGEAKMVRSMHGWKDHKCVYTETITTGDNTVSRNCYFTREQVNELVSAMKSDPNGESIADQVWERYRNIPEVCVINN